MRASARGIAVPVVVLGLLAVGLAGCGASDSTTDSGGAGGSCPIGGSATPCAVGGTASSSSGVASSTAESSSTASGGSSSCNPAPTQRTDDFKQAVTLSSKPDGLQIGDITLGTGAAAGSNSSVVVEYTGWLQDGSSFDSSRGEGRSPFPFQLGAGSVIRGWDEGVPGMKVGGVRRLVIPPSLGYGAQAKGPIPPNSTLTFDIELLAVC